MQVAEHLQWWSRRGTGHGDKSLRALMSDKDFTCFSACKEEPKGFTASRVP